MLKFVVFLLCGFCVTFLVPTITSAGGFVPCGGEGQAMCGSCDVVKLANNVIAWLVLVLGIVASIIFVYAGIMLVTSGGNQSAMESAKSKMSNVIIGYVIILAGWLVIDYGLKALVNEATFGVWNELQCTVQETPTDKGQVTLNYIALDQNLGGLQGWVPAGGFGAGSELPAGGVSGLYNAACNVLPGPPGVREYNCSTQETQCRAAGGTPTRNTAGSSVICTPRPINVSTAGGGVQCGAGNSACSVAALQAAGMTSTQANVMSCIAMTESSGNPNVRSNSSTACGTFQILRGTWAGAAPSSCTNFSNCTNSACNAQTAAALVRQSGYSSWTCPGCNVKAQACKERYGG